MHILQDENGNPIPHGQHDQCHEHQGGCGEHGHCHAQDKEGCPGHEHHHQGQDAPQTADQMTALLDYMVKHNEHHAAELDQMAEKLRGNGHGDVAEQVRKAVDEFQKGNLYLNLALSMMRS